MSLGGQKTDLPYTVFYSESAAPQLGLAQNVTILAEAKVIAPSQTFLQVSEWY